MRNFSRLILSLSIGFLVLSDLAFAGQVNVYSSRKGALILPLLETFSAQSGIEVKLLTGKDDALLRRLELEGEASPADILITADVARLHRAETMGLLQGVENELLTSKIPSNWRDVDNHWFAVTSRARPIIYAHDRVSADELSTYEQLASDQWQGRLCMRSSSNVYNQSLVASKLLADGEAATAEWLAGLVTNFARPPVGGDTDQLKAVAAGVCDVTLANTYYLARLASSSKHTNQLIAEQLSVYWPNQDGPNQKGRGTHFNISGIALTNTAKNRAEAIALMEFMVSDKAQEWYAQANKEYPVVAGVPMADVLAKFGTAKADKASLTSIGQYNSAAVKLMDKAGWR